MAGVLKLKQKQPTITELTEVIGEEPIALNDWGMFRHQFVTHPAKQKQIEALWNRDQFLPAIKLTLEFWKAEREVNNQNADLASLVALLKRQKLIRLAGIIEETFIPGAIIAVADHPGDPGPTRSAPVLQQRGRTREAEEVDGLAGRGRGRRSEVDISHEVTHQIYVVSLVRIANSSQYQHAFIIIEGNEGDTARIWFLDFVSKSRQFKFSGCEPGKIRIDDYPADLSNYSQGPPLLYSRSGHPMMNPGPGATLLTLSWKISAADAKGLIRRVKKAKTSPPPFVFTGDKTLLGYLQPKTVNGGVGHNCFTWAMEQLRSLGEEQVRDLSYVIESHGGLTPATFFESTILARFTTVVLPDPKPIAPARTRGWLMKYGAVALFVAGVSYLAIWSNFSPNKLKQLNWN